MGQTGLAHMFEHMAFKGTDKIGTTDYAAEKVALAKVETAYAAYIEERDKRVGRDEQKLKDLQKAWQDDIADAQKYVKPNEFPQILESNGAEGLNASTSEDQTEYHYSFPENRLELWAYLESERFMHPVMREFYKERNVVIEERRMRVDSNPIGRLLEQFTTAAFQAHPYHRPGIGWMSDLNSFLRHRRAALLRRVLHSVEHGGGRGGRRQGLRGAADHRKIFWPHPLPRSSPTSAPPPSRRRIPSAGSCCYDRSQPLYLEGYHRPDYRSPDDAVYDAIADLMSNGRTSRLYRALVRDKKIAAYSAGFTGLPGNKYPHLFAFYAFPLPGHKNEEVAEAIHVEIDRLKKEDISDEELKMIRTRAKANLLRGLDDNEGLASELALYQARYGDWRELFHQVENLDKVSKADIRRVANQTFVPTNRTVGIIETVAPPQAAASKRRWAMKTDFACSAQFRVPGRLAAFTPLRQPPRPPTGSRSTFRRFPLFIPR